MNILIKKTSHFDGKGDFPQKICGIYMPLQKPYEFQRECNMIFSQAFGIHLFFEFRISPENPLFHKW
jgi:hypothetical protein